MQKPPLTGFELSKLNVLVPSDSKCFHVHNFHRHCEAIAPGKANKFDKVSFKFLNSHSYGKPFAFQMFQKKVVLARLNICIHQQQARSFSISNLHLASNLMQSLAYFVTWSLNPAAWDRACLPTASICYCSKARGLPHGRVCNARRTTSCLHTPQKGHRIMTKWPKCAYAKSNSAE